MEAYRALIVFAVAFCVTYAMVPASKYIGVRIGAIDFPGNRRVNDHPVPRTGGIALYVGFLAGAFAVFVGDRFFGWSAANLYVLKNINLVGLYWGITCMFGVGLVDDIVQLKPLPKLAGQVVAAVIIVASGASVDTVRAFDGGYVGLGPIDAPFSVLYLVVFVNITNLIDGLDGLAAGVSAIVAASLLCLVCMRGAFTLGLVCLALIAACVAFLRFNFHPASVFMGDGGSHFLGCMLGVLSIVGVVRTQGLVAMIVPLVIAGVPVLDTLSSIVRRRRAGVSVGKADTGHLHHRLMRQGFGQVRSVLALWGISAALAVAGVFVGRLPGVWHWVLIVTLIVVVAVAVWRLGLFEPVLSHHYQGRGKSGPRVRELKRREREQAARPEGR